VFLQNQKELQEFRKGSLDKASFILNPVGELAIPVNAVFVSTFRRQIGHL